MGSCFSAVAELLVYDTGANSSSVMRAILISVTRRCCANVNNQWRLAISEEDSFQLGFVVRKVYEAKKFSKEFTNKNWSLVCEEVAGEE